MSLWDLNGGDCAEGHGNVGYVSFTFFLFVFSALIVANHDDSIVQGPDLVPAPQGYAILECKKAQEHER